MDRERVLDLIDTHSGGDVSRIVTSGIEPLPGKNVLEKARYLEREGDGLRRLLLSEPYGDPAMSVNLIVEPSHPEAVAGYIIMEAMGYPLYSGSNTICTATALLQSGMIPAGEGLQEIVLESPAGFPATPLGSSAAGWSRSPRAGSRPSSPSRGSPWRSPTMAGSVSISCGAGPTSR